MTIHRLPKTKRYSMVDNALAENPRLSWEARGVAIYVLTKPDDWQVRVYDLVRHGPAGPDKIRRILKELEVEGNLGRRRVKLPNGKFDWVTDVYESPSLNPRASGSVEERQPLRGRNPGTPRRNPRRRPRRPPTASR